MAKLLKILLGLVLLAGAATGVYAYSRGGKKADGGMKLVDAQNGSITERAIAVGQIQPRQKVGLGDMTLARRAGRVIEVRDGRILKDSAAEAA
jgi:hypothetical protein